MVFASPGNLPTPALLPSAVLSLAVSEMLLKSWSGADAGEWCFRIRIGAAHS